MCRHRERDNFLSAHIDDLLLVESREDTEEVYAKLAKQFPLKIDGPFGTNEPGKIFYLKRQVELGENCIFIAPNAKYIPKLAELLGITERRGNTVPHHSALTVVDAELIPVEEYLNDVESKMFRSALGICLYIAQERLDTQQTVKVLSTYMGRPRKTALYGLRKLGAYLVQTQDMKMHYHRANLFSSTLTRWNGVEERRYGRPQ